jgi:hypothetical protein
MTRKLERAQITELATILGRPDLPAHPPRTFGLPTRLYGLTVGAYAGFLAVTAIGFATGRLMIPIAICLVYLTMAFGVPSLWARMNPANDARALRWDEFRRGGIVTATGRIEATDATIQVLILPAVVFFWGIACVVIAGLNF